MRSEAPFILKALRLVSIVVMVALVALAASVGYSAYQEYKVLGGLFSQGQNQGQQQNQNSSGFFSDSFNGTTLILTSVNIPNNMTYPIGLQLEGILMLAQTRISSFSGAPVTIEPGQAQSLQVDANVNISSVLSNSTALNKMLLRPVQLSTNIMILASVAPLLGLDVSKSSNSTMGPILGQFSVNPGNPTLSSNGQDWVFPVTIGWNNSTPLLFQGTLGGVITQVPGKGPGNYGSASSPINVTQGSNRETLTFYLPTSQFGTGNVRGEYDFNFTISAFGTSVTVPEGVTV